MMIYAHHRRNRFVHRIFSGIISAALIVSLSVPPSYAQTINLLNLPVPGAAVSLSQAFNPILIKGLVINPAQPLQFDFLVDATNSSLNDAEIKQESEKMIKYFLAALTVPKDELWVNLSPYEREDIVPEELGQTELGRDMLAQDYILKQLTATLIDPQKDIGKEFWAKIRQKVQEKYGTQDIPVNAFSKVWIVPNKATVFEKNNVVYITESSLKIMLDNDYWALENNSEESEPLGLGEITDGDLTEINDLSSQIVREVIIPSIEKEVNEGKNFAPIRQIYQSLILAQWYKETIKESLLSQVYVDQRKVFGIDLDDKTIKEQIYERYVESFKKGVFEYIKDDFDSNSQEVLRRQYFSGGVDSAALTITRTEDAGVLSRAVENHKILRMPTTFNPQRKPDFIDNLEDGFFDSAMLTQREQTEFVKDVDSGLSTYAMIKPDGIEFKDDIVKELQADGLEVVVGPEFKLERSQAEEFYQVHKNKPFFKGLIDHMVAGLVLPLFIKSKEGNAVERLRKAIEKIRAKHPAPDLTRNRIHGSDSVEAVKFESGLILNRIENDRQKQLQRIDYLKNREGLKLSNFDANYLTVLARKFFGGREELKIGTTFIPSALDVPGVDKKQLGVISEKEISGNLEYLEAAKKVVLKIHPMNGGVGSSYVREGTLKRLVGRTTLWAKSMDSYFEDQKVDGFDQNGNPVKVSQNIPVNELKYIQYIKWAREKIFGRIIIQELVNNESREPMEISLKLPYLADRVDGRIPEDQKRTVKQVIESTPGLELAPAPIEQKALPIIDAKTGEFIDHPKAVAPGGHGHIGAMVLQEIAEREPDTKEIVIRAIFNGDGVNNAPTPEIVGWMAQERIPIVMVTTTKTPLDRKGGLIGQEVISGSSIAPAQIFEEAQAKQANALEMQQTGSSNQLKTMFYEMGLTVGNKNQQLFNTNISLQNETVLHPFLKRLKEILDRKYGPEKFIEITSPDLITNPKDKEIDGQKRSVFQLEGAKASALLNLNKFVVTTDDKEVRDLMAEFGFEKLVHFVNFEPDSRTAVFTPEKYAWDHWLYDSSGMFKVNTQTGRLERVLAQGESPSHLPGFELENNNFYKDSENVIKAFKGMNVVRLNQLEIKGKVLIPGSILVGNVVIESKSKSVDGFDLTSDDIKKVYPNLFVDGQLTLVDVSVTINEDGSVTTKKVSRGGSDQAQLSDVSVPLEKLRSDVPSVRAAAIKSLADYRGISADIRTRIVNQLFGNLLDYDEHVDSDLGPTMLTLEVLDISPDEMTGRFLDVLQSESNSEAQRYNAALVLKRMNLEQRFDPILARRGSDQVLRRVIDRVRQVGGIDLDNINLKREGSGIDLQFVPDDLKPMFNQGVDGFTPVIINIFPLPSVLPLLGLDEKAGQELEVSKMN